MNELPYQIQYAISEFRRAVDRKVAADIDAACCRTERDYQHAHKMEEQEDKARDKLEEAILLELKAKTPE